jgi:hypothetical protein
MDEDRRLEELADGPLDETDVATVAELRALYDAADPVPVDLVERARFSLALDEMFDEVARMTRVPLDAMATRSEDLAGTRTETLTFSAERLTAMVTVSRIGPGRLRLDGWLAPPGAYVVRIRLQGRGQLEVRADEEGRFAFEDLQEGFGQLSFHPAGADGADDADNTVVTPVFEL